MENNRQIQKIDIRSILKAQKMWILRNMPGFLVRLIERIIHQKEMNEILLSIKYCEGMEFVEELRRKFGLKLDVAGEENLPLHNRLIFAVNHSLGAIEGMAMLPFLYQRYGNLKMLANNLLMHIKSLHPLLLPVSVFSKTAKEDMKRIAEAYESETNIYTFPAGRVSRVVKGKVMDNDWHKSFVENAITYKRKVIPILVENVNSKLFYRVFKIRRFLGIKTNIELFLLPHEMLKSKNQTIRIRIGKPILPTEFTPEYSSFDWAQKVKEHVYALQNDVNRDFKAHASESESPTAHKEQKSRAA